MDHTIRRQDRKLSEEESIEILQKGEYGVLSMCSAENEGYGIPLNYVFSQKTIYFHCAVEGSKLDFLKNKNKVSFCVVGNTEVQPSEFGTIYESAIAFGTVYLR
jgi:nitroimidazol reductase NimA-like FMN-containing flavoprotein (pyridoxamine 5'-phosphate oxidase superfamily)